LGNSSRGYLKLEKRANPLRPQSNMNRYKVHTQSARGDGVPKYPKGYEQHMAPEGGFGDTPHIKKKKGTDPLSFYGHYYFYERLR